MLCKCYSPYKYEVALICSLPNSLQILSLCQLSLLGFLTSLKSCSGNIYPGFNCGWPHWIPCCNDLLAVHRQVIVYWCIYICITLLELWQIASHLLFMVTQWGGFRYPMVEAVSQTLLLCMCVPSCSHRVWEPQQLLGWPVFPFPVEPHGSVSLASEFGK